MFANPAKNLAQVGVTPGMIVVDLGAGTGHYALEAANMVGMAGKVFAVDVQKNLLDKIKNQARERDLSNIEYILADFEQPLGTNLGPEIANLVIFSNSLSQAEDKKSAIKEAIRIMKRGGKLLVIDWRDSYGGIGPHQENILSEDSAKKLMEVEGLIFQSEIATGEHHYGFIYKKAKT